MDAATVDNGICALLRGDACVWPLEHGADADALFIARAGYHGVAALLNQRLPALPDCPLSIREVFQRLAIANAFWDLQHQKVIGDVLGHLTAQGIRPVLFKGTALAYGLYATPGLRSRADTDVIVAGDDAHRAGDALQALGFALTLGAGGEVVSSQASYIREDRRFGDHAIDLHWRISNSALLSKLFSHDELLAEAKPLPSLHATALAAGPVHALMLACLHRAVHRQVPYYVDHIAHYGGDRLVWLYDIFLLGGSFSDAQWRNLVEQASKKGLRTTCLEGFMDAAERFGLIIPEFVRNDLSTSGEPVARYLKASRLTQNWLDFASIPTGAEQVKFARELLFPSGIYMRGKYPDAGIDWLPWLYARRAFEGILKRWPQTR